MQEHLSMIWGFRRGVLEVVSCKRHRCVSLGFHSLAEEHPLCFTYIVKSRFLYSLGTSVRLSLQAGRKGGEDASVSSHLPHETLSWRSSFTLSTFTQQISWFALLGFA
jgi:hypothetical protein